MFLVALAFSFWREIVAFLLMQKLSSGTCLRFHLRVRYQKLRSPHVIICPNWIQWPWALWCLLIFFGWLLRINKYTNNMLKCIRVHVPWIWLWCDYNRWLVLSSSVFPLSLSSLFFFFLFFRSCFHSLVCKMRCSVFFCCWHFLWDWKLSNKWQEMMNSMLKHLQQNVFWDFVFFAGVSDSLGLS